MNAPRPPREVMKHTSWLSAFAAVRRPRARRALAHLCLRHRAHGQEGARQLRRVEHVQHVALVLGPVSPAGQLPAVSTGGRNDPRVMAGGDGIETEHIGPVRAAGRT